MDFDAAPTSIGTPGISFNERAAAFLYLPYSMYAVVDICWPGRANFADIIIVKHG